jgi:hypothetical protein
LGVGRKSTGVEVRSLISSLMVARDSFTQLGIPPPASYLVTNGSHSNAIISDYTP